MDAASLALVLATVFLWGVFSAKAESALLTAPIVFVVAGFLYAEVFDVLDLAVSGEPVKLIVEVALVWLLFSDASGLDLRSFRSEAGTYARLLGVAFPLTVGLGTLVAVALLGMDPWAALFIGAALAPTDAALGAAVMSNPRVPARTRLTLNVESGLNDGIATPVVIVAIAGMAADHGIEGVHGPGRVALALLVGVLVGVSVGLLGGRLLRTARRRHWLSESVAGPAVLALALLVYTLAILVDGNGFVAAFVAGLVFGGSAGPAGDKEVVYVEETGALASMLAWLLFGALALPILENTFDWRQVLYAVLSLTVIRMIPVAVSMLGTSMPRAQIAFLGWFGPRGLASVIFAMLALEDLHGVADELVATVGLTVLLSVLLHGISGGVLATRGGAGASVGHFTPSSHT